MHQSAGCGFEVAPGDRAHRSKQAYTATCDTAGHGHGSLTCWLSHLACLLQAAGIVLVMSVLLSLGVRESAWFISGGRRAAEQRAAAETGQRG